MCLALWGFVSRGLGSDGWGMQDGGWGGGGVAIKYGACAWSILLLGCAADSVCICLALCRLLLMLWGWRQGSQTITGYFFMKYVFSGMCVVGTTVYIYVCVCVCVLSLIHI